MALPCLTPNSCYYVQAWGVLIIILFVVYGDLGLIENEVVLVS